MYDYKTIVMKHLAKNSQKKVEMEQLSKLPNIHVGQHVWLDRKDATITSINIKTIVITFEDGKKKRKLITQIPLLRLPIPGSKEIPSELLEIKKWWDQQVEIYALNPTTHSGPAVLGAKLEFTYKNEFYEMHPMDKYQGELNWVSSAEQVKNKLFEIGCQDVYFDRGRID